MTQHILDEILKYTKSKKSVDFYKKAITILGKDRVFGELGELKYQMRTGEVKNPAKYFTKLLKNQIDKYSANKKEQQEYKDKPVPYENTQRDLLRHLMPKEKRKDNDIIDEKAMKKPYFGKNIPQLTFTGPQFFTLSSNKNRSDEVMAKFITREGTFNVPLVRGKTNKNSKEEFGLLTVSHKKIFDALKIAWARKGCNKFRDSKGVYYCKVVVAARELADILKWKKFGGKDLMHLTDSIQRIKASPYLVNIADSDINLPGLKNYHFSLIDGFSSISFKEQGGEKTYFSVIFSSTVSWQLINRYTVNRAAGMLEVKSELTHLIWSYIEPTLRKYGRMNINLSNLIEVLQLPKRAWHEKRWRRKQVFQKAIKELNGQQIADGRQIIAYIEKGLQDYMLVAVLSKESIQKNEKLRNKKYGIAMW